MNYTYPLDYSWSHEEMTIVINLFTIVEKAYEMGITALEFEEKYRAFKKVVPSIGQERQLAKEFEQLSGYSLYRVQKEIKSSSKKMIKVELNNGQNKRR